MTEDFVRSIFTIAKIPILSIYELPNKYWPNCLDYYPIRKDNPWWLVKTPKGLIEIGRRKRVFSVNWTDTGIACLVTEDDVTKDNYYVHAWTDLKLIEYMCKLSEVFEGC